MIIRLAAVLIFLSITAHAQCAQPQALTRSVMYISTPDLPMDHMFYTGGTAWVLDAEHIVTVKHTASPLLPIPNRWTKIKLSRQLHERGPFEHIITYAFVESKIDASPMEGVYVLRIAENFRDALPLAVSRSPTLQPNMPIAGVGYTKGYLRLVHGRYVRMANSGDDKEYFGYPLIEVYNGVDRLALLHGSSGGPLVDCFGRVWSAASQLYVMKGMKYIGPTPWGEPTNAVTLLGTLGAR